MKPQTFQPYNQLHVQVNKLRHSPRIHRIYENDSIHTGNNKSNPKMKDLPTCRSIEAGNVSKHNGEGYLQRDTIIQNRSKGGTVADPKCSNR
jgi:hypothetical protein